MKYIGWLLPFICVIGAFSFYAYWIDLPMHPTDFSTKGLVGDSFGVLNSLFSGLGFAGLTLTIWIQQGQIKRQEQEHSEEVQERRSLFNLDAAIDATEQARLLLTDSNNDRRTWIEAARLLGHAKVLGEGVSVDCHQRVLEATRMKYRRFFSQLLEEKSGAYFYGVDASLNLGDAACAATSAVENRGISRGQHRQLDEASIYKVWEAAQWPKEFNDPVGQKFSHDDLDRLSFNKQGLREYLLHIKEYNSIRGLLTPKRKRD